MNIILMIFDSLRKDCVGVYGGPPWGAVHTPHFEAFAAQSLVLTRAYPESLPTLPARRAIYTGRRVYPFHNADFRLKGDFRGAPGWGPIPEEQPTLAEMLQRGRLPHRPDRPTSTTCSSRPRTSGVASTSGPFCAARRWTPTAPARGSPKSRSTDWFPKEMRELGLGNKVVTRAVDDFVQQCVMNYHDRPRRRTTSPRACSARPPCGSSRTATPSTSS